MSFLTWLLAAILIAVLAVILWRFTDSLIQVRVALDRLANRDFRPVLFRHPLGFFRRTSANLRTISELLKRQDQQIVDEGFSLRAILSSMVEGVMIVDPSQRIRLVNSALQRMFQMRQSPINRSVMEVFLHAELHTAIGSTLQTGEGRAVELTFSPPGGEARHFDVYAVALNPGVHSKPLGSVVVFHDVTRVRDLEAVRKEFVANVSHEFRTPLAIISGYLETLLDGALDDRPMAERSLGVMQKHAHRLNLLIDDLLTISRLENRAAEMRIVPVFLPALVRRVVEQMTSSIEEKSARVTIDFPPDFPAIEADENRMEQVIVNLFTNALRYGGDAQPVIVLSGRADEKGVVFSVQDNGQGIPLDDQAHIFERFYRVHKDRSRDAGGTGLGLSIVKNVVLAHGGEVSVDSKPGQGAVFRVFLPWQQPQPPLEGNDSLGSSASGRS